MAHDWEAIRQDYIFGDITIRGLAAKYGVDSSTIGKRASKEQWVDKRQQNINKTSTKTAEKIINKRSSNNAKAYEDYQKSIDNLLHVIVKATEYMAMLVDDGMTVDAQDAKRWASALGDIKELRAYKTDADKREQEARIRNLEANAEKNSPAEDEGDTGVILMPRVIGDE